ncbi:gamma-glutamyltranspeptidase-domain-containing protein [Aspergillus ambiguus]|uniref:gamma-glutamyltranspeptidase-domain-containing protein n=1 Tax=Aspergillus ambiguus TaxID=176160 RepID=UPI003CCC9E01
MPSRRSHTKSRKGCLQCKRRHVKCDEDLPKCGLCKKRKLDCTYPPPSTEPDGQSQQLSPSHDGPDTSAVLSTDLPLPTRMLEMRLFHLYLTETYITVCQGGLDANHFQCIVPRMATAHPYLLDALLALTALHQASMEPGDNRPWLEAALKYQSRACSALGQVLADFSLDHCGPAFICSIFIMLSVTAYPCITRETYMFDPLSLVLEIRRLIAGCSFLFQQLEQLEHPGEMGKWLRYKEDDRLEEDSKLEEDLADSLRHVEEKIDAVDDPKKTTYRDTWAFLLEAVNRWPWGRPNGGIIAWPINISEDYIVLLKQGEWIARILFLHYGISLSLAFLVVLVVIHLPNVHSTPLDLAPREASGHGSNHIEEGKLGAVASESALCSHHGTDMLKKGGNAADAMVATMFCVGVVGMYHSGIGGGGFMLVKAPDGSYEFIDFRETAPAAAFEDMYANNTDASTSGGLASGVPGEVRGLEHLHKKYGSLPWATVMQPAIDTARNGFPVTADLVRYMESAVGTEEDFLSKDPTWAIDFAPNGTRLGLGDTITRRRYADTLETIAKHGPDALYSGPIAETMIQALQAANGTMTLDDLANYTVAIRNVSQIDYRGYTITSTTAPSSGIVAMSILKIVDTYDAFFTPSNVNLSTHRLDEAMRFAYGQRTLLGDPAFVDGMDEYQEDILSRATVEDIRRRISDYRTQNVSAYDPDGFESLNTPGTSHIATADHSGFAISAITTINLLFGSKVMVPETGIIMNNEMDDFSTPGSSNSFGYVPSPANYIRPGKRPLSSITPAIVTHPNGTVFFISGSAGGSRIITATVQNIIHAVDEGMSAAEALAQPRLHDQLVPNQVSFEYAYDNQTVAFMKARGHNVTWVAPGESTAQAIRVLANGTFDAAGEPRQENSGGFAV